MSFEKFPPPHTGGRIANILYNGLKKYGLTKKFLCATGDSASNNIHGMARLAHLLEKSRKIKWSYIEGFLHCSAHAFNIVAHDICKPFIHKVKQVGKDMPVEIEEGIEGLDDAMAKGRISGALSKIQRLSVSKNQNFQQYWTGFSARLRPGLPVLKLVKSVDTRWNSRHLQIESALKMRKVYDAVTRREELGPKITACALSDEEWEALIWLDRLLEKLNECTNRVGATKSVTISHMVPAFSALINIVEDLLDMEKEGMDLDVEGGADESEATPHLTALTVGLKKLRKYFDFSVSNPYYVFGMSTYNNSLLFEALAG